MKTVLCLGIAAALTILAIDTSWCAGAAREAEGFLTTQWPAVSAAKTQVLLSSKLDDNVVEVAHEEGEAVAKDDILVRFDSRIIDARIKAAEVAADFAARIAGTEQMFSYRKAEYNRLREIQGDEPDRYVMEFDVDKARHEMRMAELDLQELERGKLLAEAQLALLRAQAQDYTIRSPIDGLVSRVWIDPGEMAQTGQPLVEVLDPGVIEVTAHLPEEHAERVFVGQTAMVRFPAVREGAFSGEISVVSPYVDSRSGKFAVKVLVRPETDSVKPGMECRVQFTDSKQDS